MASEALALLVQSLNSKPKPEKITPQELNFLLECQSKAKGMSTIFSSIGGVLAWGATSRLRTVFRVPLSVATAGITTMWINSRYIKSTLDDILGLDGTRLQRELANILVKTDKGETWRWKLMSKHFYLESVFNDATDKAQIKWRNRNTISETISSSQTIQDDADSSNDSPNVPKQSPQLRNPNVTKAKTPHQHGPNSPQLRSPNVTKAKTPYQHGPVNSGSDVAGDPFDCVLGVGEMKEDNHQPGDTTAASRVMTRKHKRALRRRRLRNQEEDSSGNAQYQHV